MNDARGLKMLCAKVELHVRAWRSATGLLTAFALAAAWPAVAPAAETCSSATVRVGPSASLPDCRAYEQVSPVEKNGFGATFERLIGNGEQVQSESLGLFSGATGSLGILLHHYVSQRASTGWETAAVETAPSELAYAGSQGQPVLVNANKEALLLLHPAAGSVYERDVYKRNANGSFTEVGPMLPSYAVPSTPTGDREQGISGSKQFVGTTPDLSHTLFTLQPLVSGERIPPSVETELWPGDTTVLGSATRPVVSLYEYVGEGNSTPSLVGVDNGGHLLSNCGVSPGGSSGNGGPGVAGNHHNAISESGETVFFTALGVDNTACGPGAERPPVEELFARLGSTQTVAISQPSAVAPGVSEKDCLSTACKANTSEEGKFRDANFEGASTSGSKVFFTSTQQLLDQATQDPSAEDSARELAQEPTKGCRTTVGEDGCNLYEYDFSRSEGERLQLLSGGDSSGTGPEVQGVTAVSEDGSHVYFVAKGTLTHEPRRGCLAELDSAELAEEETTREGPCRPKREGENLYVRDTAIEQTSYVATLAESDSYQWTSSGESPMDVTDDGQFLVFTSSAHLTPGDTGNVTQVFRYGASTGALVRVSVGDEGFNSDGNASSGETYIARGGSLPGEEIAFDQHPAVSADGRIVVFKSTLALTPGALENKCVSGEGNTCFELAQNVYEYNEGHVHLISYSPGPSLGISEGAAAVSPLGTDIFFVSRDPLVSQDTDSLPDIYDARVGGGFPAHSPPTVCEGESCQGSSSAPSIALVPGSTVFTGIESPPLVPSPVPKTKTAGQVRAEKLAATLRACRRAHRPRTAKRKSCEATAREHYGPTKRPKKAKKNSARKGAS